MPKFIPACQSAVRANRFGIGGIVLIALNVRFTAVPHTIYSIGSDRAPSVTHDVGRHLLYSGQCLAVAVGSR